MTVLRNVNLRAGILTPSYSLPGLVYRDGQTRAIHIIAELELASFDSIAGQMRAKSVLFTSLQTYTKMPHVPSATPGFRLAHSSGLMEDNDVP
jgi:hypothetical protein